MDPTAIIRAEAKRFADVPRLPICRTARAAPKGDAQSVAALDAVVTNGMQ
jgi:hypothetical protein